MRKRRTGNYQHRGPDGSNILRNRWVMLGLMIGALVLAQLIQERRGGSGPVPDQPIVGKPHLTDGDSFDLAGETVRLVGIDAPEGRQTCTRNGAAWPCGEQARARLAQMVGRQTVTCRARERDQHGRLLAVCSVGQLELNREMVASGMALAYGSYEREEAAARREKRGLWSGEFERPRQWRRQHGTGRE